MELTSEAEPHAEKIQQPGEQRDNDYNEQRESSWARDPRERDRVPLHAAVEVVLAREVGREHLFGRGDRELGP